MILALLAVVLGVLVERLVFANLTVMGVTPPLGVVALVLISLSLNPAQLLIATALAAYLADLLSLAAPGLMFLAMLLAGTVLLAWRALGASDHHAPALVSTTAAGLVAMLVYLLIPLLAVRPYVGLLAVLHMILYTLSLGCVVLVAGWWGARRVGDGR